MATVTATFTDGQQVRWTDGEALGDPFWIAMLDSPPAPRAQVRPDAGSVELAGWRGDPWAFVAGVRLVDGDASIEMEGMPAFDDDAVPPDRVRGLS